MANENRPIRDRIGEYLSLSRFAKCMDMSRPTLYKYMDAYDRKEMDLIPDNVLKVFDKASTETNKNVLRAYFSDLYANHERTEERRHRENPVPQDIADIVDSEGLEVKDIDRMIEKAQRHLDRELKKNPADEEEIENTRRDIRDLEYTREMVERRGAESRFILIYSADWTACIGPGESDTVDFDEQAESEVEGIESVFRFYLTRAQSGYTLFFANDEEGDTVEVQLLTGYGDDRARDVVGTFRSEPGMKFVRIPDLFDEDYEGLFRYRVVRSRDGNVLNRAIGKFNV